MPECRICRIESKLTEDHVPPKSWTGGRAVLSRSINDFIADPNVRRGRIFQNGVKFKTICGKCNSLLGQKYDPELTKLAMYVDMTKGDLLSRFEISFLLKPARIARAVLGHLISGTNQPYFSLFDDQARRYVTNDLESLPTNMKIYYWINPHQETLIARDMAIIWLGHDAVFSHVLKFYPLGFLVTQDAALPSNYILPQLPDCLIDEQVSIKVPPVIHSAGWPEYPSDDRVILGGESYVGGTYAVLR